MRPTEDESFPITELQFGPGPTTWTLASRLGATRQLREVMTHERADSWQAAGGQEVVEYREVELHPTRDGRVPLRKDKVAAEHRATLVERAPDAAPAQRRLPFKVAERVVTGEGIKPPAH